MSRIIAGQFGGRRLRTPAGADTRPTTDRTREGLFSSLEATADLTEGPFLDVYAGSGAVGLEALSRGAPAAYFIERARPALAAIEANIAALQVASRATVLALPAESAARALRDVAATTAFLDPPYDVPPGEVSGVLAALAEHDALAVDATVVIERARREDWTWPTGFEALRDRRYSEARLWYGRRL